MSIFQKLVTAIRGHGTRVGNEIIDSQALVILGQEIRDSESQVAKAKGALAGVLADHKKAVHEISKLTSDIEKYTNHARAALKSGDETLATEVAERIASLKSKLSQQEALRDRYAKTVDEIKARIEKANGTIEDLKFRHKSAQARDRAQKAHIQLTSAQAGIHSTVGDALESLERLEKKQEERDILLEASEELDSELSGDALDKKLESAGIASTSESAASILDSLREDK